MSGLEVIALIPTIISAFGAISVEYREWRKQRVERAYKRKNLQLQKSLAGNGGAVQGGFDYGLTAVGPAFREGDGIARETLMNHLIILQSTVISLLREQQNEASHFIHPNHDSIQSTTSRTRDGILTALSEQCQRLTQAKPIERIEGSTARTLLPWTGNCLNALTCEYVESDTNPLLFGGLGAMTRFRVSRQYYSFNCASCDWHGTHEETWPVPRTKDGHWIDVKLVLDRFHYCETLKWHNRMTFRCYLCKKYLFGDRKGGGGWKKVVMHIQLKHCLQEFQPL
ncbi:hypothetical protein ASPCAL03290 [Aspergillus calidoustus]|uniref:Uncharacterized protein n=1 Tax=Aspergillus calidoustus TaxID=454130 RepID=A0A0U5FSB3_ASPCI|nr:hypothetical protein ASPCAL03290 [Aspergillus calidoustus]